MQIKTMSFFTLILLIVSVSEATSENQTIGGKDQPTQIEFIHEVEAIRNQINSLNTSNENISRELIKTKNELINKIDSGNLDLDNKIDLTEGHIAILSQRVDNTANNFSDILATALSSDWTQVGMFWTSIILVLITVLATFINYKIFRLQTDPDVIVYATPDPSRPTIINLIIENMGKGVATNIEFSSNRPIPCRAFGLDDNAKTPKSMSSGPLIIGIPQLGPNSKRVITWGQYHGLLKGLGNDVLEITTIYCSRKIFLKTPKFSSTFFLDIKSFEGTDASDQNWAKKSAESLENINQTLKGINEAMNETA